MALQPITIPSTFHDMKLPHTLLLCCSFVSLLLASCQGNEPRYRIGISQCSDDAWRMQMNDEMKREASFDQDMALDFRCAHDDSQLQARQIDSLVQSGIDLLIVSPSEEAALTSAVETAYRKGLPVIVVDRKTKSDDYTAFIGADNRAIGRDAATLIAAELKGTGSVMEFAASLKSSPAKGRHDGFMDVMKATPTIEVLGMVQAGWEGPRVDAQVDSVIRTGRVPEFVFAHNDRLGVKVHEAFKKRGYQVRVVGIDGLASKDGGLEQVERGTLDASFIYPTGGDKVILLAQHILQHQPFKKENRLHSAVINSTTARIFRMQMEQINERTSRIDALNGRVDKVLSRYSMQNMLLLSLCIIILLIAVVMAVGVKVYFATIKHNEVLAQQKRKLEEQRDQLVQLSKELEESTQSKLTFFTEVSHDLRTPLTLIQAPVEQLQSLLKSSSEEVRELLSIIRTNADILLRLVGQTLDFRKFEAGQLKLHTQSVDLGKSLEQWCAPFRALAQKKMVRYKVENLAQKEADQHFMADVDESKMESVIYNLLSNAFKFTPEGGRVTVTLRAEDDEARGRCAVIQVDDTGQGIDPDKIGHIFERFYQTDVSHDGSGIGLATVKAYVELHGGTISAKSIPGKGSSFQVTVPCEHHDSSSETFLRLEKKAMESAAETEQEAPKEAGVQERIIGVPSSFMPRKSETEVHTAEEQQKPTILVIDDNADIRSYIRILLGQDYQVEEATNGQEGLNKALQLMPDAVVCDVMMPVMDGWECCRRLKDEWQTSHIPVMMLTACTLNEQRIAGFDCGADSYIAKPFSPDMFRSRLRNLVLNRQRLRAFFGDKASIAKADVSELDKGFAERFKDLISKRMHESELSVEDLAADMGLGRSQLYRKVKALTGYSPVELVRVARLKRAAELLKRTEKTVAEVAYDVGFSSPGYLTKCFRDYFGESPTDYAKKN